MKVDIPLNKKTNKPKLIYQTQNRKACVTALLPIKSVELFLFY